MRIDHRNGTLLFGAQELESDKVRAHLQLLARRLARAAAMIQVRDDGRAGPNLYCGDGGQLVSLSKEALPQRKCLYPLHLIIPSCAAAEAKRLVRLHPCKRKVS